MTRKLTIRKLMMLVGSTALASAICSTAYAEQKIDCNSELTQIALASQQGGEDGIWETYAHCVGKAPRMSPEFVGTAEREPRARPGVDFEAAWPDQSYVRD